VSPFLDISYLQNARAYFHETYRNYSMPGPRDIDYIFKVMSSKVKVTETFPIGGIDLVFYFVTCPCSCRTKRHDNLFVYDNDDDDDIPVDGRRASSFLIVNQCCMHL